MSHGGTNDTVILTACITILFLTSILAPIVAFEFRVADSAFYENQINASYGWGIPISPTNSSAYTTGEGPLGTRWYSPPELNILTILGGFFIGFSWLPWYLNMFMWILRLVIAICIYRLIRSGAG